MDAIRLSNMFKQQNETLKEAAEAFELVGKEVLTEEEYQKLDEYINLCTVAWGAMAKCIDHLAAKDKEAKEEKEKKEKEKASAKKADKKSTKKIDKPVEEDEDMSFLD